MGVNFAPKSYDYEVRSFYAAGGGLCIHTWHRGVLSRDMEIQASKSRNDIGRIEWCEKGGPWVNARTPYPVKQAS